MRVLLSTMTTLVLVGASAAAAVPAASMEVAIPGDQARSAVAAALAQANSTGVTFIQSRDGTPTQRNAAGTVVVGVEDGKIVNMVLREGGSTSLLGILRDPPRDPKVRRQVFRPMEWVGFHTSRCRWSLTRLLVSMRCSIPSPWHPRSRPPR